MTLAQAPERPRGGGRRPLWIAMAAAVVALAVVAALVLGGRSRPASEARQSGGRSVASTPAVDAANAVDATPATDAWSGGAFGGPGSAADGSIGPPDALQQQPQVVASQQARQRPRRAPRRQAERQRPPETPGYRVIGPDAGDAPPPQT